MCKAPQCDFDLRNDFESRWLASLVTHCFLLFVNTPASCPVKVGQTTLLFGICHLQFICALVWKNYVLALPTWLLDEGKHESRPLQGLSKPTIILKEKSNSPFCHAQHLVRLLVEHLSDVSSYKLWLLRKRCCWF